jgi:hypothetical protein
MEGGSRSYGVPGCEVQAIEKKQKIRLFPEGGGNQGYGVPAEAGALLPQRSGFANLFQPLAEGGAGDAEQASGDGLIVSGSAEGLFNH